MSIHAYRRKALAGDYVRAGSGLAIFGGLSVLSPMPTVLVALAVASTLLFAVYGLRTVLHHLSRISLSDESISSTGTPFSASLPWRDVTGFRLSYYSTRRDRNNGWWQLKLDGKDARLRINSDLEGFGEVAKRAAAAAGANGLNLDPVTVQNMSSFGIQAEGHPS